jgi:hypothetical protein
VREGAQGGKVQKNETGTEVAYRGRTRRDRLRAQRRPVMRLMWGRGRTYKHGFRQGSHNYHPSCFRVVCAVASYSRLSSRTRQSSSSRFGVLSKIRNLRHTMLSSCYSYQTLCFPPGFLSHWRITKVITSPSQGNSVDEIESRTPQNHFPHACQVGCSFVSR